MRIIRNPRRMRLVLGLGLAGAVAAAGVAIAVAPTQTISGSVSPTVLPKHGFAPVTAKVNLDVISGDANQPPPLTQATVQFDNQVKVDNKGLAVCQPGKLEGTDAAAARKACPAAIVGTGSANAKVTFPDQAAIDAPAPITIFNGPPQGGNPVVIIHAYTTVPAPTTFVVSGTLSRVAGGRKITFDVPPIGGGYGALVHFNASLGKKFKVGRVKKSYANAKCAKGAISVQGEFIYGDGTDNKLSATVKCKGRG
jgi:hypothetical protein